MGVGAENPRSRRRCNTQLEMKRCLKFGSVSYPPLHSFYFCGKTWNKAIVKVLFIWWVVEILTQALQTWHCLNLRWMFPQDSGKTKLPAPSCSIIGPLGNSGRAGEAAAQVQVFWGTWMESPEFKGVLNFRSKLSWLHLAYLDIGFSVDLLK